MIELIFYIGNRLEKTKIFSILENPAPEMIPNVGDYVEALDEFEHCVTSKVYQYGITKTYIKIYLTRYASKKWTDGSITADKMNPMV